MPELASQWNQNYAEKMTPWDSGLPDKELRRAIDELQLAPCRVLELGCGTGTNSVYLAERGFDVTAVDFAPLAIERGRQKATERGVSITWICHDLCNFDPPAAPYDFLFDRGCYHCARRIDLPGYLRTLERATAAGSRYLVLTGNANEKMEPGPPTLHEHEIRDELGTLFEVEWIREVRFEDAGEVPGPLAWSCLLKRRSI